MFRAQRDQRLHLYRVTGHEAHLPFLRQRRNQQYAFHPRELLAYAHARAAAEREISVLWPRWLSLPASTGQGRTFQAPGNNARRDA